MGAAGLYQLCRMQVCPIAEATPVVCLNQAQLNCALLKKLLLVCHLTSCGAMIANARATTILICFLNLCGAMLLLSKGCTTCMKA